MRLQLDHVVVAVRDVNAATDRFHTVFRLEFGQEEGRGPPTSKSVVSGAPGTGGALRDINEEPVGVAAS